MRKKRKRERKREKAELRKIETEKSRGGGEEKIRDMIPQKSVFVQLYYSRGKCIQNWTSSAFPEKRSHQPTLEQKEQQEQHHHQEHQQQQWGSSGATD